MPNDLCYFHESDLDKGTLESFHNSLPDHLRTKFKDSFGGFTALDIDRANFLQGYRGPHNNGGSGDSEYLGASNGLQEVRYWFGVSKKILWIPVAGAVVFAAHRVAQDTNWHSLYFDSKTGECLSHSKNKAAKKLNDKGRQLFQEGKYAKAAEYHDNAYRACSSGYKNEQKFKNMRDRAEAEDEAAKLNSLGERLFSEGKYTEALRKYQMAYDKSQTCKEYNKYSDNIEKAKAEIDAIHINSEGDNLFSQRKYTEAHKKYQEAYDKSDTECDKYYSNRMRANAEIDALNLNFEGDILFGQSQYTEALKRYQEAYDKSWTKKEYYKYDTNIGRANAEIYAFNLNFEADNLFSQSKYFEALHRYQEAYDKSYTEREKYSANIAKALAEIDASQLNFKGDILFGQSQYTEALRRYQEAYDKSGTKKEYDKYSANREKAKAEIDALKLNSEGDYLFSLSQYTEAHKKYQEAYAKSVTQKEYDKYSANSVKAKAESEALNFSLEGDRFFSEGKYCEAQRKYKDAYDKSVVEKEKYVSSKNNVQDLMNRLSMLATIWMEAWEAENDTANDRSGEAEQLFQRVLSVTNDSLKKFPGNLRLKHYEILVSLKIDGNELFNEGIEAQQDGSYLLQEAEEFNLQQMFESALFKYNEAQSKFSEAHEKFKTGREKDQRFVSCVDFVQSQISEVLQSIEMIEQRILNSRLLNLDISLNEANPCDANSCQRYMTEDHNNYFRQI